MPEEPRWIHFTGQPLGLARAIQNLHLAKRVENLEYQVESHTGHIRDLQNDMNDLRDQIGPWLAS